MMDNESKIAVLDVAAWLASYPVDSWIGKTAPLFHDLMQLHMRRLMQVAGVQPIDGELPFTQIYAELDRLRSVPSEPSS